MSGSRRRSKHRRCPARRSQQRPSRKAQCSASFLQRQLHRSRERLIPSEACLFLAHLGRRDSSAVRHSLAHLARPRPTQRSNHQALFDRRNSESRSQLHRVPRCPREDSFCRPASRVQRHLHEDVHLTRRATGRWYIHQVSYHQRRRCRPLHRAALARRLAHRFHKAMLRRRIIPDGRESPWEFDRCSEVPTARRSLVWVFEAVYLPQFRGEVSCRRMMRVCHHPSHVLRLAPLARSHPNRLALDRSRL